MRYYFDGDSNLYGYHSNEKPFTFPTKVKQMGAVDHRRKIYVEDYVYTYLYQYGKSHSCTEKVAALVGREIEIDGEEILMICGATDIQCGNLGICGQSDGQVLPGNDAGGLGTLSAGIWRLSYVQG